MPHVKADKSLAKALYLEGLSITEVASKLGATPNQISQWKFREKWEELPRKDKTTIQEGVQHVAEEFAQQSIRLARKIMCKLESLRIMDLRDCKDAAAAIASAYATARKALGLDDQQASVHLHLHSMGPGRAKFTGDQAPVIDVTAEPDTTTSSVPADPAKLPS